MIFKIPLVTPIWELFAIGFEIDGLIKSLSSLDLDIMAMVKLTASR
jgi:hypothetical protein